MEFLNGLSVFLCAFFMELYFSTLKKEKEIALSKHPVEKSWTYDYVQKRRATHHHIIIFHLILLNISRLQCKVTTHYRQFRFFQTLKRNKLYKLRFGRNPIMENSWENSTLCNLCIVVQVQIFQT